ncbi:MAG: tetratricopeptide repeat protein [Candidatus Hydrogenedentes bacterium]|nr:tetratricopeptide repeat protein [Candidatus Hydrogenedentota bacterium]
MNGIKSFACRTGLAAALCLSAAGARGADHVLLVGGLGGEAKYEAEFAGALSSLRAALVDRHGYNPAQVHVLAAASGTAPAGAENSTLESIRATVTQIAIEAREGDTFLAVLVGHGQSDFQEAKFNLPGPDMTAVVLKELLDVVPCTDQRVILSFPCSGHFSPFIARTGRAILASTDGPRQIYHAKMTAYLARAFESDLPDANGDSRLSVYELYNFLSEQVEGYFISSGSLQTENPSLDDNGDGKVTTLAEGMDAGDGEYARTVLLTPAPSTPPATSPATSPAAPESAAPEALEAPEAQTRAPIIPPAALLLLNAAAGALPPTDDTLPLGESPAEVGQQLEKAWTADPKSVEKAAPYIRYLNRQGQGDDAILVLRALGDRGDLGLLWGETYWYRGELEPCRDTLNKIPPDDPASWCAAQIWLLRTDYLMGAMDSLERRCQAILAVDPLNKAARLYLAEALMRRGNLEEAEATLNALSDSLADDVELLEAKAVLLDAWDRPDEAATLRASIETIVTTQPPLGADGLRAAAAALRARHQPQAASQCLEAALRFCPAEPFLLLEKARLYLAVADTGIAAACANNVLGRYTNAPLALNLMADIQWALRKDGTAVEALCQGALKGDPTLLDARCALIRQRLIAGAWDTAAELIAENRAFNPRHLGTIMLDAATRQLKAEGGGEPGAEDSATYAALVADLLAARADYARSSAWFARALQAGTRDGTVLKHAGLAEFRSARFDSAASLLEKAFATNPYDVGTKNMLDLLDTVRASGSVAQGGVTVHFGPGDEAAAHYGLYLATTYLAEESKRLAVDPQGTLRIQLCSSRNDINIITQGIPACCAVGCAPFGSLYLPSAVFVWTPEAAGGQEKSYRYDEALHRGVTEYLLDMAAGAAIPRWFREGLARHEAEALNPEWQAPGIRELIVALRAGYQLPLATIETEYLGERNPLVRTYAGLVVDDWVAQTSFDTVRGLLGRLRDGETWPQATEATLGAPLETVDLDTRARILERFREIRVDDVQPVGLNALVADGVQTERSRLDMASVFFQSHRLSDARSALAPLLETEAPPTRALLISGRIAAAEGRYEAARDQLDLALQLENLRNENLATAEDFAALGAALAELGARDAAVEALKKSIALNPYDTAGTGPSVLLLELLAATDPRPTEYYTLLESRLPASRTDTRGRVELARWLERKGEREAALRWYKSAAAIRPDWIEAHQALAPLAESLGNHGLACASYRIQLLKQPENLRIQQRIAVCEAALRNSEESVAHVENVKAQ